MRERRDDLLLRNIKIHLTPLKKLLDEVNNKWTYEDGMYRFYHHSFKVYGLQYLTMKIVEEMESIDPRDAREKGKFHPLFMEIIAQGTNKAFHYDHNAQWPLHTRPIVEAFLHAKYVLEMMVKYGEELNAATNVLPSGWAAVLYQYGMR